MHNNIIIHWSDNPEQAVQTAVEKLNVGGQAIVSPTKVGYIIVTADAAGVRKKFQLKNRPEKKPAVVLCSSVEQMKALAQTTPEIDELYQRCYDQDILLGCILPWRDDARRIYIPDGADQFVHDSRNTSCFVIRFGQPSERIARQLWENEGKLIFASSANPSGQGNRGRLEGVGEQIYNGADLLIEADGFVRAQQPNKDDTTRYEQGVMISMISDDISFTDTPVVIRRGLDVDKLMLELTKIYDQFDYRHGAYY